MVLEDEICHVASVVERGVVVQLVNRSQKGLPSGLGGAFCCAQLKPSLVHRKAIIYLTNHNHPVDKMEGTGASHSFEKGSNVNIKVVFYLPRLRAVLQKQVHKLGRVVFQRKHQIVVDCIAALIVNEWTSQMGTATTEMQRTQKYRCLDCQD